MAGCTYLFEPSYDMSFRCSPDAGDGCPADQPCPEVPLAKGGCEDIPGMLGQPPIPLNVGRPAGCIAWLPYGNPYYEYSQQSCVCGNFLGHVEDGGLGYRMQWSCPL